MTVLTGTAFSAFSQTESSGLRGFWEGSVSREGKIWRVNFEIVGDDNDKTDGKKLKAVGEFLDAGASDRLFTVTFNSPNVRLERSQPNGTAIVFSGKVEGDTFSGEFSGLGKTASFTLRRTGQTRHKFYREERITFKNGEVTLAGTLLLPLENMPALPAIVFTHGGAAEARSSNKDWALLFVRRGIAALIYDKRGVGESSGDWRNANLDDLADDALAAVRFLKTQKEIDSRRIGVAGHSQGGTIAPLAAVKSKDVAFVISSAPSGVNYAEQSVYHRANVMREAGFSEDVIKIATDLRERLYATGRMLLENNPNAAAERRKISAELDKYKNEPWLEAAALPPNLDNDKPTRAQLELLFFEPLHVWQKLRVPVLFIWGEEDTTVPVKKGQIIIDRAQKKASNKDYTIKLFPNVTHTLTIARPVNAEWDFPRFASHYLEFTADWLATRVRKTTAAQKLTPGSL